MTGRVAFKTIHSVEAPADANLRFLPRCETEARPLDLATEGWTTCDRFVTCRRCKEILNQEPQS